EHYPAPYALIDLWETHGGSKAAMLRAEQASFAKLMVTPTAQNLIRVFFLREQMKKAAGSGNTTKHVHVIGAGAMGGDIAAWCAGQGLRVSLADMKAEPIAGAVKRAAELYGKILRKPTEVRDALDRLIPDMDGEGVRNADLIIEAVPEKLELKQKVYAGLEPRMKPGAILATNTSSIPLQDLRTTLQRPERLLGLHFFNPVSRLQLVEVVSHDGNDPALLKEAMAYVGDMLRSKFGDSLPPTPAWLREKVAKGELGRKTGKGFYTWKDGKAEKMPMPETGPRVTDEMIDRLVLPMSNVCVACLREGIVEDADAVDGAMIFGTGYAPFRGGPLNYARARGVENVVSTLRALAERFGGRFAPD